VLLNIAGGDLGLQKLITDGNEANTQNIIHYASYPLGDVEYCWRVAVEMLTGECLPAISLTNAVQHWVGTPHSYDIVQLKQVCEQLQNSIIKADLNNDLLEAFPSFSLYMAVRLGLATAGPSTKRPLPRFYVA